MRKPKFDVGDVVRIVNDEAPQRLFSKSAGKHLRVIAVHNTNKTLGYELESTDGIWELVIEDWIEGVPLEEVQQYYADKPRRGFIVDGLTVDELEGGQNEVREAFQRAVKQAEREAEEAKAKDDCEERSALAKLIASFVLWLSSGVSSMICWNICGFDGEVAAHELLGLLCTVVGMIATCKPMCALIVVCRDRIKERRREQSKRNPRNME